LGLILRAIFSMLFLRDPRLFKEQFLIKLAASHSRKHFMTWQVDKVKCLFFILMKFDMLLKIRNWLKIDFIVNKKTSFIQGI